MMERMAPEKLKMPSGSAVAVDYGADEPVVKVMAIAAWLLLMAAVHADVDDICFDDDPALVMQTAACTPQHNEDIYFCV